MSKPHGYLCLAGPTASGKTATALAIAESLRATRAVEIISVDSALVYRGMDIGTAKPSAAERAQVPHHLIDIIEPTEAYSAARFVADARMRIAEIHSRGALALLVGGTMLYFKALFEGLDEMPAADAAVRAALNETLAREGLPALYDELQRVDPVTAARLAPGDSQRIQRALEVYRVSGQPLSAFHREKQVDKPPPLISLEPNDRAWLHQRIAQRFEAMLAAGFLDEVKQLRARGDLHADLPSMRCVGYRQAWEALDSGDLASLPERGIAATRQLAKRQVTWLRGMPYRHVVACDRPGPVPEVEAIALAQRLIAEQVDA
ncbi:tRNA (adenosine(37)-N6)-dimethylallyltransferase MiaA [Piscinibacter sp. HJYY11]|uniref:tRNA (adenosine(37)-N6)-dimethylallyltransferase MiaA n=1 Tax=Piscinibacter sp. HJYY11 TaxID=2801333 RepID=UPI00191EAF45|nr:tRNA (adenosine(37)-N6)-dimethylallyltransferase MiaA [Piscinibacter sp. HJYY11]MBL0730924.1 tRNA (adenosine(37)-N6)-dimethylallyltransferase MiaA [Piscinibacter sp. HJYY11]